MNGESTSGRTILGLTAVLTAFGVTAAQGGDMTIHVATCGNDAWTGLTEVCEAPDGPKATIQAGIDAAADGDAVIVAPGTYFEAIDLLGKAITVRAADRSVETRIDALLVQTSAVTCANSEGPGTVLDGFTVASGYGNLVAGLRRGGGMYNEGTSPTVTNCDFTGNIAARGGGMYNAGGSPTVRHCRFFLNTAFTGDQRGAGMYNDNADTLVSHCLFVGNFTDAFGGGIYNVASAPVVTNTLFLRNNASNAGAGMMNTSGSSPTLTNCAFNGNAAQVGAGMYNTGGSNPLMVNCEFVGNLARLISQGGAIANDASAPAVIGGTFTQNSADTGGAMFNSNSTPTVVNATIWGNGGGEIVGGATVSYSNVRGGFAGPGNIDAAPSWVSDPDVGADGFWASPDDVYGDLRYQSASAGIDAGDNDAVPEGTVTDIRDEPRFVDDPATVDTGNGDPPLVDIGASEYQGPSCVGDVNGDNFVAFGDVLPLLDDWGICGVCAADLNDDGIVDFSDVLVILAAWGPCP